MRLLAIDTSTPAVAVALHDGAGALAERVVVDARRHGELVAPLVAEVLAAAGTRPGQLTAIAVGVGPGPYTGLRVGIVTAKVMAHALGIPAYGVCGLDALALRAELEGAFAVLTDARRREVYWAGYAGGQRISGPSVDKPDVVAATVPGPFVGPGAELYRAVLGDVRPPVEQSAVALAELAVGRARDGSPSEDLVPLYLRRPDVSEPVPPKAVS